MESHVMYLGIILCLLAGSEWIESGRVRRVRVKRQSFPDYQDEQDVGLAFITVQSRPIHTAEFLDENFGNPNQFNQNNQFNEHQQNNNNNNNNHHHQFNNDNNQFGGNFFQADPAPPRPRRPEVNKIPGIGGVDYPMYHTVPPTNFRCSDTPAVPGMYANVETGCQAYHVCHDGRDGPQGASFLCTNGTLFNQKEFICDWWYNVDCGLSLLYYNLNLDPLRNPYTKREREEELRKYQEYNRITHQN